MAYTLTTLRNSIKDYSENDETTYVNRLIFDHPVTGKPTLFFHPRMEIFKCFAKNVDLENMTCEELISKVDSIKII